MLAQLVGGEPGEGDVLAERGEEEEEESASSASAADDVKLPLVSSLQ